MGLIQLMLACNVTFNIVKEKIIANLLKAPSDMCEKPSAINKVYLMQRLFNLKISGGVSVANHINEFNVIISQLYSVEIDFEDEVLALIQITSLPNS